MSDITERLRAGFFSPVATKVAEIAADEIDRLRAALADAQRDAERYRWVRADMKNLWGDDVLAIIGKSGKHFDAAIDAAILATKEGKNDGH